MAISLTVRHGDAPADLQSYLADKCERLGKYLRDTPRIEFVLHKDHLEWVGEAILHGSRHHERLVAKHTNPDARTCGEVLIEKLERQLEKGKERRKDHRGPSLGDVASESRPDAPTELPTYEEIVRRKLDGRE